MTKRTSIRIVSFVFAAIGILLAFGLTSMRTANSYKTKLELNYQQSLNELAECLDSIETNLTKSVYANSDQMLTEISSDLYSECSEAKNSLSRLPIEQMNLSSTYKFLSQAADYAGYLASKAANEEEITEEEHQNLSKLLEYAQQFSNSIDSMVSICNSGGEITNRNIKSSAGDIDVSAISTNFTSTEDAFSDYPTLLYDGPFADAVLNKESQMLKNTDAISNETARDKAAAALNCNISEISYEGEEEGAIPCYIFTYGQYTVGITKNGGYVSYILFGGKITSSSIAQENAVNIAKTYLNSIGYQNMETTYYAINNNICVINFAYIKNNVTCYSDLIKVGVSMNNGKVVSVEAKGYLINHTQREQPDFSVKQEDAQEKLNSHLSVLSTKKCIIPKDNGTEVSCWEFRCKSDETDEEVLIYVNSQTGAEEDIMLLLYSDNGTFTK